MLWYKKAEHKSEIYCIMVLDNQSTGGFHIMLYINYGCIINVGVKEKEHIDIML